MDHPSYPDDSSDLRDSEAVRQALDETLQAQGLMRTRPLGCLPAATVSWLHRRLQPAGSPALLTLLAKEAPGLLPHALEDAYVWYLQLPAYMSDRAPSLLEATLSCFGALTGDPWRNGVFVKLLEPTTDGSVYAEGDSLAVSDAALAAFTADRAYIVLVIECACTLYARGIPIGEELTTEHNACRQSSFQKPLRNYSVKVLQERTRAVEDTGIDPEGHPAEGNQWVPVVCSRLTQPNHTPWLSILRRKRLLRRMTIDDAVIGWLPDVTYLPREVQGPSSLVLKIPLPQPAYTAVHNGVIDWSVQALPLGADGRVAYVALARTQGLIRFVAMPSWDERFAAVYDYWARHGTVTVAFENYRNGRLAQRKLPWPTAFVGRTPSREPVIKISSHEAFWRFVDDIAGSSGERASVVSDVVDQCEWRAATQT